MPALPFSVAFFITELNSVFIAETKDTQGFVLGRNQVLYLDTFEAGSVKADIRYTTTASSFEADLILREQLPDPRDFEMRPELVRAELWTEILNADVQPDIRQVAVRHGDGQEGADIVLDFGAMRIGPGKAFSLAVQDSGDPPLERERNSIAVSKEWITAEGGRRFLIESVPYVEARPHLERLPQPQARIRAQNLDRKRLLTHSSQLRRAMPVSLARGNSARPRRTATQLARLDAAPQKPGFVLDWVSLTTQSNCVLKGDTTYRLAAPVNLTATTTIEGGVVIKADRWSSTNYIQLMIWDTVKCLTSPYRPAIITGIDDSTVGETIGTNTFPGSTRTKAWIFSTAPQ